MSLHLEGPLFLSSTKRIATSALTPEITLKLTKAKLKPNL